MDPTYLALTPAATPPPGVTPDFVNGEKYGLHTWATATIVTCMIVSTIVLALRMFARIVVIKTHDWSDCMPRPLHDTSNEVANYSQTWP